MSSNAVEISCLLIILVACIAGNDVLLKALYEAENQTAYDADLRQVQNEPLVWRYRQRVTIEHLAVELAKLEERKEHTFLRLFLKKVSLPPVGSLYTLS